MKNLLLIILLGIVSVQLACTNSSKEDRSSAQENDQVLESKRVINPNSDPKAVEIAEKVLAAHGGEEA